MSSSEFELDARVLERLALDDRQGPAVRLPSTRAVAMVDAALDAWPVPVAATPVRMQLAKSAKSAAIAAAGVLALTFGVAAAYRYFAPVAPVAPAQPTSLHLQPRVVAARAQVTPVTPAAQPAPAAASGAVNAPEAAAEAAQDTPSAKQAPRAVSSPSARAEPEDLLQRANRLRAEGKFAAAAETYAQVYEQHPRALSAYVAQVAAASIELEHLGHAARAKRLFERAIIAEPQGALDIEARQGLALSSRDLGDARSERAALQGLVAAHAHSPAAVRAAQRLRELSVDAR